MKYFIESITLCLFFLLIFCSHTNNILSEVQWQLFSITTILYIAGCLAILRHIKTIHVRYSDIIGSIFIIGCIFYNRYHEYLLIWVVWFIYFFYSERKPTLILWSGILLIGVIEAIYGISQYFNIITQYHGFSITGHFDNPAGFAAFMVCILPFTYLFINNKNRIFKLAGFLSSLIIEGAILFSYSRAGILASCILIFIWIYHIFYQRISKIPYKLRFFTIVIFASIIFIGLCSFKKDSANGRLLIWRVSWEMIKDKPLLGHGYKNFQAKYMEYQATYLDEHPKNKYINLASDVKVPFNEYLKLIIEYGFIGIFGLIFLSFYIWTEYARENDSYKRIALLSIISIAIFAAFSYPFDYYPVLFILTLDIAVICKNSPICFRMNQTGSLVLSGIFLLLIGYSVGPLYQMFKNEKELYRLSLLPIEKIQPDEYKKLYMNMPHNYVLLYNYGAYLNKIGEYAKSNDILKECTLYFNNSELQLFLSDNYLQLGNYTEAEKCAELASCMVPARFYPLYYKFMIAEKQNNLDKASVIARQILNKKEKIKNTTILTIKAKMEYFLQNKDKGIP